MSAVLHMRLGLSNGVAMPQRALSKSAINAATRAPRTVIRAVARPSGANPNNRKPYSATSTQTPSKFKQLITPFSDPQANSKMLALATSQMLCSVATLIHDTYLPVYLSDVLHLSNSKVHDCISIQIRSLFACWSPALASVGLLLSPHTHTNNTHPFT